MTDIVERGRLNAMAEMAQMSDLVVTGAPPPITIAKPNALIEKIKVVLPPLVGFAVLLGVYWYFHDRLAPNRKFLMPWFGDLWSKGLRTARRTEAVRGAQAHRTGLLPRPGDLDPDRLLARHRDVPLPGARTGELPVHSSRQAIPVLAIAPLLQVGFGYGLWPKTLVRDHLVLPIPTTLLLGLQLGRPGHGRSLPSAGRAGRPRCTARAPGRDASLFAGLRIAAGSP
jgi:ABC-type nitrate/sulfonate/bicarbonate transport system permease component